MAEIFSGGGHAEWKILPAGPTGGTELDLCPGLKPGTQDDVQVFCLCGPSESGTDGQVDVSRLLRFKIQMSCRDWPAQQKRRESFRRSVLPRGELPLPRIQNFWPPLSDEARRKTHCPIRASAIQTRGTRRPFPLLSHGEEITRSSTVFCSSQVPTTQHGSTVRRGPVLHPAIASRQNTMTLLGVQAGIVPLGLTLDLS